MHVVLMVQHTGLRIRVKRGNVLKGYNFKWGKRVDPDPSDPEKIFIITFGGGVWHGSTNKAGDAVDKVSIGQMILPRY